MNADIRGVATHELKAQARDLRARLRATIGPSKLWDKLSDQDQEAALITADTITDQLADIGAELDAREATHDANPHPSPGPLLPGDARWHAMRPAFGAASDHDHIVGGTAPAALTQQTALRFIGGSRTETPMLPYGSAAHIGHQAFEQPGILAARFVKAFMASGGNLALADQVARQMYGADGRLDFKAALMTSPATGGGFLVPETASREIIELLRHATVVRRAVRVVPMAASMSIPTQASGVSAAYIGEMADDNAQDLTFGQRRLVQHKLRALVVVSNDLIRSSTPEADMIVRDDLTRGLATAEDYAFIRGDGTRQQSERPPLLGAGRRCQQRHWHHDCRHRGRRRRAWWQRWSRTSRASRSRRDGSCPVGATTSSIIFAMRSAPIRPRSSSRRSATRRHRCCGFPVDVSRPNPDHSVARDRHRDLPGRRRPSRDRRRHVTANRHERHCDLPRQCRQLSEPRSVKTLSVAQSDFASRHDLSPGSARSSSPQR